MRSLEDEVHDPPPLAEGLRRLAGHASGGWQVELAQAKEGEAMDIDRAELELIGLGPSAERARGGA
jgi:hypothetical protein